MRHNALQKKYKNEHVTAEELMCPQPPQVMGEHPQTLQ